MLSVSAQDAGAPVPTLYNEIPTAPVTTTSTNTKVNPSILLAQVNLYGAKLQKAGLVNYTFSFTLKSADLIDQEAYYRILLRDKDGQVVFLQNFPNKVVVPAGESSFVNGVFITPQDFKGVYSVYIQVTNDKGLPLATVATGEITLSGGKTVMGIKSCSLTGSATKTTSDAISGSCMITGKTTNNTFLYTTVYYGTMASPSTQLKSKIVSGKSDFTIPPRTEPGTYQVVSQLYDAGSPMSSPIFSIFRVDGQSAKITTIKTDKGTYSKDEVAKLAISLKTVNINSGDISIVAKLETQDKNICGEFKASTIKNTSAFTLDIPVIRKCAFPAVTVTISDKAGKVLDTLTTVVVTTGEKKGPSIGLATASAIVVLLALVAVMFYYVRRIRGVKVAA